MDRQGKQGRAKRPGAASIAVHQSKPRRAKRRGKLPVAPTRWAASPAVVAAMAAPQIMVGPVAFAPAD